MRFRKTAIDGVVVIDPERHEDDRGFFARTFCVDEFVAHGLDPAVVQCNISYNARAGTVRGLHFQEPPVSETKLVRCTLGAIHDVVVDLRADSPTYRQHVAVELTATNRRALYVAKGLLAHGFQTLEDDTEVSYQMGERYTRGADRGVRYNEPALGISWPSACVLHRGEGHGLAPPVVTAVDVVDAVVVGGGIVGLATARRLAEHRPDARVIVLEKEASVGRHQSSHNSGVLHAGLYYAPGSRKAELCRRGKAAVEAFAEAHGIPVVRNGKLVVAVGERELPALAALTERAAGERRTRVAHPRPRRVARDRATCRRCPGASFADDRCRRLRPGVRCLGQRARRTDRDRCGGSRRDEHRARPGRDDERRDRGASGRRVRRAVVVAARQTRGPGDRCADRAVPWDMARVATSGADLVRGNIYPVPDPELPFLGVHFTRRVDGSVWSGPNAVLSLAERAVVRDALRFGGLWRLGVREARVAVREF